MRALSIVATLPFCWAKTGLDQPFTSSYAKLDHAACYSLFHRKGRAGCGTESHNAQVGQLKYFDGSLPDTDEPYVAVIEEEMLTAQTFETLLGVRGGLLKGVLVLNATSEEDGDKSSTFYSPDGQFPRGYGTPSESLNYGYYKYAWNPKGQGLLDYDMHGIPLAYVIDSDVATSLRQESMSEGVGGSIVAEFNYYMGPENMNSINCLQWKDEASKEWNPKCLPLGGTSVWASAGSPPNPNKNNNGNGNKSNQRPVVILAAGMDSTSLFHDLTPGANTAASNILTVLMAARMIGKLSDNTLDNLPNRIVFALFEGETYGFMGSRSFLRDVYYPGFKCYSNIVYSVPRLGEKSGRACLNPLRPSLQFSQIGQIKGMISVDQIGRVLGDGVLYVHADKNKDQYGSFIANVLKYSYTSYYKVASATEQNNNYGYAYPPSPLTSLLQLSQGAIGGAVLTGYDYAFTNKVPYHSHRDSASLNQMNLQSIAAAATIVARGALAAAYDDGNNDYQNAANYAMEQISELDANDELLTELSNCLLYDGECDLIRKYSQTEVANERIRTGANFGNPNSLGTPPNYYVGVYNRLYGQPFVLVGDQYYGAYSGNDFGNKKLGRYIPTSRSTRDGNPWHVQ